MVGFKHFMTPKNRKQFGVKENDWPGMKRFFKPSENDIDHVELLTTN